MLIKLILIALVGALSQLGLYYVTTRPPKRHEADKEFKQAKRIINYQNLVTPIRNRSNDDYVNELLSEGFNVSGYMITKDGMPCYAGQPVSNGIDVYRATDSNGNMVKVGHVAKSNYFNFVMNDDIYLRW